MPQIQDLDAEDEEEQQQAAKRARQQEQLAAAAGSAAGAGAANGLPLSELPEVAAAMRNPGQLQVCACVRVLLCVLLSSWLSCCCKMRSM
jgi:hypothetical protein